MFDAKNMWLAMAAFVLVLLGFKAVVPAPPPADTAPFAVVLNGYGDQMTVTRVTREDCVGRGDRLWLAHKDGNDCVTVIVPPSLKGEGRSAETAVVYIHGDVPTDDQNATGDERMRRAYVTMTASLTERFGVPVLMIARPGILGSSGTHQFGGKRNDVTVVDATLDELKRRHGIKRLVMVGQSGGARVVAQLLVLGRLDISCGVMGSGAYETPNVSTNLFGDPGRSFLVPMRHAADVPAVRDRRLFIVGDPRDQIAQFPEQRAWADKLVALNHHAILVETEASGDKHHGASRQSLEAAGLCAKGAPDSAIIAAAKRAPS